MVSIEYLPKRDALRRRRMSNQITKPPRKLVEKFSPYSTTNVSDALDKLGLKPGMVGILPIYEGCPKLLGTAITMRVTAAGPTRPAAHMGVDPIMAAGKGDVIVIDNAGHLDENCWGEIMTYASIQRGISGVVIDGACRDVDVIKTLGFPVYARGRVPLTARGRTMQDAYNCLIRCGGVQVRPGDIIMADDNGVVVIPQERAQEVLETTADIFDRESAIVEDLKKGIPLDEVDRKSGYDKMLNR
jgi:4-hydroxy-4-methyl-2-oxoglutarate aldolase